MSKLSINVRYYTGLVHEINPVAVIGEMGQAAGIPTDSLQTTWLLLPSVGDDLETKAIVILVSDDVTTLESVVESVTTSLSRVEAACGLSAEKIEIIIDHQARANHLTSVEKGQQHL